MKRTKFWVILLAAIMSVTSAFSLCACKTSTGGNDSTENAGTTGNADDTDEAEDLSTVLAKYTDISKWNFATNVTVSYTGGGYEDHYEYLGYNILWSFENEGYNYTDYLGYNASSGTYYYYMDMGGTYEKYADTTDEYAENYSYMDVLYLEEISKYSFNEAGGKYAAALPNDAGNAVLGEYENASWTSFNLYIANGYISKITATSNDGYSYKFEFSKYGTVNFKLPDEGTSSGKPTEPTGTMEKQVYDSATFEDKRLQEKMTTTGDEPDPATGLPSTGTYSALVIPVKFSNTTIDDTDLTKLNIAFNGDYESTGWESVTSYYKKASYGKLNLSFDIAGYGDMESVGYYTSDNDSSFYETHTATEDGQEYNDGDNVLLHEVLEYYEDKLDLENYDTNGDGAIDAVYLIYSAPVDYSNDSFYWAYVTWNFTEAKYDSKDTYYYLFAGLDFMDESVSGSDNENYPVIDGLKVNAATYIHETGHLLGLDDYYDYNPGEGSDEGLGGADMMDSTVGDQNVYSKTMLGWLTPTVVNSTQTVTIKSSQKEGDALLIPLDFNNSYFCEYLLIDLYSADGLNKLHSSSLYDGADYGVRIYHVSATVTDPFNNDFGSFTDNNNSSSALPLIMLVEADGTSKFSNSDGYAAESDLWQAGDKLSTVFPQYMTNAGKLLIFDIEIVSVSATEATIQITYNA